MCTGSCGSFMRGWDLYSQRKIKVYEWGFSSLFWKIAQGQHRDKPLLQGISPPFLYVRIMRPLRGFFFKKKPQIIYRVINVRRNIFWSSKLKIVYGGFKLNLELPVWLCPNVSIRPNNVLWGVFFCKNSSTTLTNSWKTLHLGFTINHRLHSISLFLSNVPHISALNLWRKITLCIKNAIHYISHNSHS